MFLPDVPPSHASNTSCSSPCITTAGYPFFSPVNNFCSSSINWRRRSSQVRHQGGHVAPPNRATADKRGKIWEIDIYSLQVYDFLSSLADSSFSFIFLSFSQPFFLLDANNFSSSVSSRCARTLQEAAASPFSLFRDKLRRARPLSESTMPRGAIGNVGCR
ncbi:hypothetical protein NL676_034835, partial [Syzygium grande]